MADEFGITRSGILRDRETIGTRIRVNSMNRLADRQGIIDSTAVDAGNTPTTKLRKGLCLGQITATGKFAQYDPLAEDGTEVFKGVLGDEVNMLNGAIDEVTALDQKVGCIIQSGILIENRLIGLDAAAKASEIGSKIIFR